MKKVFVFILMLLIVVSVYKKSNDSVKIPDSAIRFRILANSNSPRDQKIKQDIRDKMQKELYSLLQNSKSIDDSRKIINSNMSNFDEILKDSMKDIEYSYSIDYGMHYFPSKTYKGITYDEGNYESLLVTLGSGKGDNWWCVLFPPLCLLEAEESSDVKNVEYKSFIKEIIEKYF